MSIDETEDTIPRMPAEEFHGIRRSLGLSVGDFARALGLEGAHSARQLRRYESGAQSVPPWISRLATMYARFGIPEEWQ